jgi:hypothetical protein
MSVERFTQRLCDEHLNEHWLTEINDARVRIELNRLG